MDSEIVRYKADNGQDIEVTEQDVRDLMAANGNAMDNVTSAEVKMFLRLCQSQRLNPFNRDAYIVKYGTAPASVIAGKDAFVKRATRNKRYRGHEAGITFIRKTKDNNGIRSVLERREGSMLLHGEELVGGWCKVHLEGYACPIFDEVSLSEYSAPDKYGKNGWSRMPATMIRKVALCHALREAFPEDLGGLYGAEEMDRAQQAQPAPQPQEADEIEVIVEDVTEAQPDPQTQEDPRKALWAEAGKLKAQAVSLGVKEEGITSWMATSITSQNGSAKGMEFYTAEDITALIDFLKSRIRDMEQLDHEKGMADEYDVGGYEQQMLADEDIPF